MGFGAAPVPGQATELGREGAGAEMINEKWTARHITDAAQEILSHIPHRARDRSLMAIDAATNVMLVLWSLLSWERKVGRVALEEIGVDTFDLARDLDYILTEKKLAQPVEYDKARCSLILVSTGEPYEQLHFETLLEPMLQQAELEAKLLGHNYIGTEHLLLAITRTTDAPLSTLLQRYNINHERVKTAILALLGT